ncbi:MAG TPA: hypothetical protein PKI11_15770 [Candidatus Hydrogenedentes bacterium]|nr:hypothetical protein [Candidatus Hydrogenedentota bacterium]
MRQVYLVLTVLLAVASLSLTGCPKRPALGVTATVHHFGVDGLGNYETTWQFDVFNDGAKGTTLVFNVTADRGWIQVSPASGQSTGKTDPVTVTVTIDRDYAEAAKLIPPFAMGNVNVGSSVGNKRIAITTAPNYFTEEFDENVDLEGRSITFSPNGSLSFYGATQEEGITDFPTDPTGGLILNFNNVYGDPVRAVPLGGKKIPYYEGNFESIYISSQGHVGMGNPGSSAAAPEDHFAQPQISVFPLNAKDGGQVSLLQDAQKVIITYEGVPTRDQLKQGPPVTNDIQLELFFNGDIRVSYLEVDPAAVGVVGLSSGAGENGQLPPGFVGTDFSNVNTGPAKVAL